MTIVDFIALTLAASAIVDVWFNGSIFADRRAYYEAMDDAGHWLGGLLSCKFCFSHHPPYILALLFFVPAVWVPAPWDFLLKLPVYCLAAVRLGNIINAFAPAAAQYERTEEEVFTDEEMTDDGPTTDTESDPSPSA